MKTPMKTLWTSVISPPKSPDTSTIGSWLVFELEAAGQSRALTHPGRPGRRTRGRKHTSRQGVATAPLGALGGSVALRPCPAFPSSGAFRLLTAWLVRTRGYENAKW